MIRHASWIVLACLLPSCDGAGATGAADGDDGGRDTGEGRACAVATDPPCPDGLVCVQTAPPYCNSDFIGRCESIPENCATAPYGPVCDCDGATHRSPCEARHAGVYGWLAPCPEAPCPGFSALATPEEIAATPRADLELEELAVVTGNTVTADPAIYDRLVQDVPRIRAADPTVADIHYLAHWSLRELMIQVDDATMAAMEAGTYTAWDCPDAVYRAVEHQFERIGSFNLAFVRFDGVYDYARLADEYGALPGVESSEPNATGFDGSTICVTRDGDIYHYIFDRASGDCPEGCTVHVYTYYRTDAAGTEPVLGGVWDSESGEPAPAWVELYTAACR